MLIQENLRTVYLYDHDPDFDECYVTFMLHATACFEVDHGFKFIFRSEEHWNAAVKLLDIHCADGESLHVG